MGLLKKNKRVGLDLGSFSVKAVGMENEMLGSKNAFSYAVEYLPPQASRTQISETIRKAVKKIGTSSSRINIAVSGQDVIVRYIPLPKIRKSEIIEAIKLEWDKYISLKQEEVVWDLQVLGPIDDPLKGKQLLVLLVAVKKNFLEEQINLLKDAGLSSDIIDTNVSCLVNAFDFLYSPKAKSALFALLNIGESITNLIILKDGLPRFSRDILFGGRDITHFIAQKKRIDFLKAQELKHNFDGQDQDILAVLKYSVSNLINEIKLSFEYLKRDLEKDVKIIYISGGSSHLYGIKEFLSHDLGIKVETWKLNANLGGHPELAVALGLVLS
jgi:type IV pilus assembly protein PilM